MGRPYDPFSGLVSVLFLFALGWAIFGWLICYIWFAVTGRLAPPAPLPPDEAMTPEQRVLTPGYGLSSGEQEPDLPYPMPEAAPRYMREAERAAWRAELRHNDYETGERN